MSASPARIHANQINAQLSTGPRTEAGKAASSQNARTHGLCSHDLIVQPHEEPEFNELLQDLRRELQPQGALEQALFDQLIHAAWNLRRIRRLEAGLCRGLDPLAALDDEQLQRKLDRLGRHHTRHECSLARSMRGLKKLQTERTQREALAASLQPKPDLAYPAAARNEPTVPKNIAAPSRPTQHQLR